MVRTAIQIIRWTGTALILLAGAPLIPATGAAWIPVAGAPLIPASRVRAQDSPPPDPPPPVDQPPPADSDTREAPSSTAEAPSAREAVQAALDALDAAEAGGGDVRALVARAAEQAGIAQALKPDDPRLPFISGRMKILGGRAIDGIRDVQAYTRTTTGRTDWKAFRVLGDAFINDYASLADAEYRRAYALNDREPTILLGLSRAARKLGRPTAALELAARAVELDGRRTVSYLTYYARLLLSAGRQDEALQTARLALDRAKANQQRRPDDPVGLIALQSQYQAYMAFLRNAISQAPDGVAAYVSFARAGQELGELDKLVQWHNAVSALAQGVANTAPNTPASLRLEYARLLGLVGRTRDAATQYELILSSEPENEAARKALDVLRSSARTDASVPPGEGSP